jgi:hypothetical protein
MMSFSRRPISAAMTIHATRTPPPLALAYRRLGRVVGGLAIGVAVSAAGQRSSLNEGAVVQFVRELQRNVARDDRQAIAAHVRYPLTVFVGGVRIPIASATALIEQYDMVFTPALKAVIADARGPAGGRSGGTALTITPEFASIGADAVRIERIDDALTITRITLLLAAAGAPDAASSSRRAPPRYRPPQRLHLDVGQLQRAGGLGPGERNTYLISATKNQLLELRITGVAGRAVVVRVTNVKTRKPLDDRAENGVRTWVGRIPADGDYRIDVVRLEAAAEPRLSYLMTISKR